MEGGGGGVGVRGGGGGARGGGVLFCGWHGPVPLVTHSGSAWACPSRSASPTALMIVSTLAPAITARCANFLIVSSPVRVGLMPSLPPGFSAPEAPRQGRRRLPSRQPVQAISAHRSSPLSCALAR